MALSVAEGLESLRGLALPDPPGFWPPAPGWYAVGLVLLAIALGLAVRARKRFRENRYRRLALKELALIRSSCESHPPGEIVAKLAALLKRTALVAYPRQEVAALAGQSWLAFLDDRCPGAQFRATGERVFVEGLYGRPETLNEAADREIAAQLTAAETWIRRHEMWVQ